MIAGENNNPAPSAALPSQPTGDQPMLLKLGDPSGGENLPLQADSQAANALPISQNADVPPGFALPDGYYLEILLSGAGNMTWLASYYAYSSPRRSRKVPAAGSVTSTTPVRVVPAAPDRFQHILGTMQIDNQDTVAGTVTVRINNGTTTVRLKRVLLQPDESITFTPDGGWIPTPDLTNYLYKPGRSGGQTAYGGTATNNTLVLRGNSVDANGGNVDLRKVLWSDNAADPAATGEWARNGAGGRSLRYHDGTAVRDIMQMASGAPANMDVPYHDGAIWQRLNLAQDGHVVNRRSSALVSGFANRVQYKTAASYTVVGSDAGSVLYFNTAVAGAVVVTLPTITSALDGMIVTIQNTGSATVTINRGGSDSIGFGGASQNVLNSANSYVTLMAVLSTATWYVLNANDWLRGYATGVAPAASGNAVDIATLSIPAGEWDLSGVAILTIGTMTITNLCFMAVTNNAGTIVTADNNFTLSVNTTLGYGSGAVPAYRISVNSASTYKLRGYATYSAVGTATWSGRISARRVG